MRTRIFGAALAALVVASPAAAQDRAFSGAVRSSVPASVSAASDVNAIFDATRVDRARKLLARGERRWESYDLKGAERAFAEAALIMQEQQVYAGPALVSLAYVTYASGRPADAGRIMVDAAAEAAQFGDLELQAQSLYDASIAFAEAGDLKLARSLQAQATRVLASPMLPDAVKVRLLTRMATGG